MSGGAFACTCGALAGRVEGLSPRSGTRLECFCADCRAAQLWLDQPDPRPGGVGLFQTAPDRIHIDRGAEHLALMRLSPKGLFRWYASCCRAPLFNTLSRPGLPFAAVVVDRLETPSAAGKVRTQGFLPGPDGRPRHKGAATMAFGILQRMLASRLSGRWRETPFFHEDGAPRAKPRVLDREERARVNA